MKKWGYPEFGIFGNFQRKKSRKSRKLTKSNVKIFSNLVQIMMITHESDFRNFLWV